MTQLLYFAIQLQKWYFYFFLWDSPGAHKFIQNLKLFKRQISLKLDNLPFEQENFTRFQNN